MGLGESPPPPVVGTGREMGLEVMEGGGTRDERGREVERKRRGGKRDERGTNKK